MMSVVLVNWNGWADTISCIQSLLSSDPVAARIIVVDNASSDDSLIAFERWARANLDSIPGTAETKTRAVESEPCPYVVKFGKYVEAEGRFTGFEEDGAEFAHASRSVYFVSSGRNGGFGFGCNVGMRLADTLGTTGYWLLNNDCVAGPEALRLLSAAIHAHPEVIFGTVVRYNRPPYSVQAFGGGSLSRVTGKGALTTRWPLRTPLNYIYGASMGFSARCRSLVGDFDEKIFMYYEEIDFCLRAAKAGIRCDIVETDIFHKQGGSQGGVSVSAWTHVLLNKRYVLHKHFGWGTWTIVYFLSLFLRCFLPLGDANASIGARRALKTLTAKWSW